MKSLSAASCLLHWQTPFWASGLEKEWATASVESDGKPPFLPSRLWEWPFSSQGAPQLSLARLPLHPLHAFVHLVLSPLCYWQKQSPPLHDLGANISFTDQDLQQPQLGLNLLVFIVFFSHRSAVFFLHVPSGSESRS